MVTLVALLALACCEKPPSVQQSGSLLTPLPGVFSASPRLNGGIYTPPPMASRVSLGNTRHRESGVPVISAPGQYSLDFSDTDVRDVVAQILGSMLRLNYSIDPAVKGTVTLHTARPLTAPQLLPALEAALGTVGAILVRADGLYQVVPSTAASTAGSIVMPLNYTSAEDLAKVLQAFAGNNSHIAADPAINALLINGDPAQVQSLADLIRTFDSDALSGQSYAVLPVAEGNAKDFADSMTQSLRGKGGSGLGGLIRVVPLPRVNAVLVVSPQPRYIEEARRIFDLIERQRRATVRVWHAYYLQNSNANDIAYTLQMAFTPNNVNALPQSASQHGGNASSAGYGGFGAAGQSGASATGAGASGIGAGGAMAGSLSSMGAAAGATTALGGVNPMAPNAAAAATPSSAQYPASNPLLGGLDQSAQGATTDAMRILPNAQNNAILVYGTAQEIDTVAAMLRKIDITPLQVRIDAVIAEVTLNDALQYGTQFFFKAGGVNGILNNATASVAAVSNTVLGTTFPGFLIGGNGQGGAPLAISALQAVTQVNVLSSPQITVVDNQTARLQVGALVPYLTSTSQSTIAGNAPVINSISYQPTGVIMQITPRVNSGGQVTLDVSQEVSDVSNAPSTAGINSPTFNERSVTSRVVVPDGQTIGLAGLIQDSSSHGNQGIPWLKDVPILGALAGTQNNSRQRTELLLLLTPHVIRDQADIRTLTQDLKAALPNAARVPDDAKTERISGSPDPNRRIIDKTRQYIDRHTAPPDP
jgi:general secretion pathway protein D